MVMFSMNYPPQRSILENNLNIFISEPSDFNRKLSSGETVSPTGIIFQYTKELSNSNKIKACIAPKMTYLIILLGNNGIFMSTQGEIFMDNIFIWK